MIMSKNIVIKQNGTDKYFDGATKIKTSAASSGNIEWVPEDEIEPFIKGTIDGVEYIVTKDDEGYLVYTPVEGGQ